MKNEEIRIWVAIPTYLIRKSLVALLRQFRKNIQIQETVDYQLARESMIRFGPDILIIDERFFPEFHFKETARHELSFLSPDTKICGFLIRAKNPTGDNFFDKTIYLCDSPEEITKTIDSLLYVDEADEVKGSSEELSDREKQVLIQVVKGLTNKEIGEELNLSVHTVISHRKNITRKLDIKSSSGLTIYAIMNNLISINDVKEK